MLSQNIAFIGAGSMAEAVMRGLVDQRKARPENIFVVNRQNRERLFELKERYRVQIAAEQAAKEEFIRRADIVVLAVKPKDVGQTLTEIRHLIGDGQLLVSVVAGLSIRTMERLLARSVPIARTMPNTSSTIGLGATGISFSAKVEPKHEQLALEMFESIGIVSVVEEQQLDIVTGVSGSGPAYVYYMMEAMIAAGIEGGLSEETARRLTVQTVLGAAQMVKTTEEDPAALRRKVTSPGGTTEAALETLDEYRFSESIVRAIARAAGRAAELGAMIGR